jgi:hypothetical protein
MGKKKGLQPRAFQTLTLARKISHQEKEQERWAQNTNRKEHLTRRAKTAHPQFHSLTEPK